MGRRELRERIFLLLFRVEFNAPEEMPEQIRMFFDDDEVMYSEKETQYITQKYERIVSKLEELDNLLDQRTEGWDVKRMGKVELTILRLALYEMNHDDDVPVGVAINEAVELAKKFGQDTSGSFVNAVLAKFV
ncbi:MAG: transcription antitermination factor NusB [Lachnospiraceae bacterium]|nr:transcription antitermination factor NusB [Lachnospiraceae bacterium]